MEHEFTDQQRAKQITVFGATGFIGSAIVRRLIDLGFKNLLCHYRDPTKRTRLYEDVESSGVTFVEADLAAEGELAQRLSSLVDGSAIVVNAAGAAGDWGDKAAMWRVNADVPQLIAQYLLTREATTHFIHISTAAVYGFSHAFKNEESPIVVSDPYYTASKAAAHTWLRKLMASKPETPVTVLAPVIVWGPGDRIYLPQMKERLRAHQMLYPGKPRPVDFVHIDDLVDAVLLSFFNEQAYNEEFIISGPRPFTFEAYVEEVAEVTELPPPQVKLPDWVGMAAGFTMEQAAHLVNLVDSDYEPALTRLQVRLLSTPFRVSIHKAQSLLGYEPEIDFATGVKDERLRAYLREL